MHAGLTGPGPAAMILLMAAMLKQHDSWLCLYSGA